MLYFGTEDKVPELLRSGGREAAAGIASAGSSIGQGLAIGFEHQREDKKRKEDELKAEAKLTKHARGILDVLDPENKHTNSQLSGDEARGRAAGLYQRNLMDKYAAEVAAEKRQAEASKQLEGFSEMFGRGLQGGVSTLPAERQSHYYENPEAHQYAEGPPRPTVSEAMGAGLAAYPGATVSKDFDTSFGSILRAFPGTGKGEVIRPQEDVTKAGVPYLFNPNAGNFQFVPTPEGPGRAPAAPRLSESFFKTIADFAPGLENPDPKLQKTSRNSIKAVIDSAFIGRQLDAAQRDEFYATYGIGPHIKIVEPPGAPAQASATTRPPQPSTQAEYDAIAPGAPYYDDKGILKRKK